MNQSAARKALLVIDIQQDFTGPTARMPVDPEQAQTMIDNVNVLSRAFVGSGQPVVYIGNEYPAWHLLNVFRNFAALQNTPGTRPDERLRIVSKAYFTKQRGDAFSNPKLLAHLLNQQVNKLYITGLYAEACIMATVRGAMHHPFSVTVVTDGVATKTEAGRQRTIRKYGPLGADITSTAQLIDSLQPL